MANRCSLWPRLSQPYGKSVEGETLRRFCTQEMEEVSDEARDARCLAPALGVFAAAQATRLVPVPKASPNCHQSRRLASAANRWHSDCLK
jgi:hypothetical protein